MKYRLLKLVRSDVAWHRGGRFLSTSAVRDNPIPTKKTRIPKSQRKAMVLDYVTKYRAINEGKFPGAANIRNQVGGCSYTIRAILQELKYDSEHKDSVVQPAAQRNDTSAIEETVDNVLTVAEAEDCGDLFENGVLNEQVLVEKPSSDMTVIESATEKSQFCANSSLPSDIVGGDDTRFGGDKNVSPTTSITNGGYSRGTDTKETQEKEIEETLLGNLKSMANRFISIWR